MIRSNVIHKSESEQTIKNSLYLNSNNTNDEIRNNSNNNSKSFNEEISNFTAPLSQRLSEKNVVKINTHCNNIPKFNQKSNTINNSNKDLKKLDKDNHYNFENLRNNLINEKRVENQQDLYNIEKMINNSDNNIINQRKYSNLDLTILDNKNKNILFYKEKPTINLKRCNSYDASLNLNNNLINSLNDKQDKLRIDTLEPKIPLSKTNSNKIYSHVRHSYNQSSFSKNYSNDMKSRSNPLLKYVTIGIKSTEDFKRCGNKDNFLDTTSYKKQNSSFKLESTLNALNVINSKSIFEKGIFIFNENRKTIGYLFLILFGAAIVYKLYTYNISLFLDIMDIIKTFFPNELISQIEKYFHTDFLKENVFSLCILITVLIGIVFLFLKYYELTKYNKIAIEDYNLIRGILKTMRITDKNSDLIGLFEHIFVKENSFKNKIDEESYRKFILPIMDQMRIRENLIEEAEICIQNQAQKVWIEFQKSF